jgi:hypothetical protein
LLAVPWAAAEGGRASVSDTNSPSAALKAASRGAVLTSGDPNHYASGCSIAGVSGACA